MVNLKGCVAKDFSPYLKYYPIIYLCVLNKPLTHPNEESRYQGRNSNLGCHEHEAVFAKH